jgi:competence protein ComEC
MCAKKKKKASRISTKAKVSGVLLLAALVALLVAQFVPAVRTALAEYFPFLRSERPTLVVTGNLDVHYIDVGQGDAILIITPEKKTVLIDAGVTESKEYLVEYISTLGITTIDSFVLTHPHADHIGGAAAVLEAFTVKDVMMPDVTHTIKMFQNLLLKIDDEGCGITVPEVRETFTVGSALFTCLGPVDNYGSDDLNDMSLVLRLDYGSTSFLFTGDAEETSEKDMLALLPKSDFKVDVLKLGHHGASTSTSKAFLEAVAPSFAIASCGKGNQYGHPHSETLSALQEKGITLLRTDEDGSIVFTSNGSKVTLLAPAIDS